jgi:hypothetical protein
MFAAHLEQSLPCLQDSFRRMRSISEDLAKKWLKITFLNVKVLLLIDFSTLLNSFGQENTVLFGIAAMYPAQGSDNLCIGASGDALPSSTALASQAAE